MNILDKFQGKNNFDKILILSSNVKINRWLETFPEGVPFSIQEKPNDIKHSNKNIWIFTYEKLFLHLNEVNKHCFQTIIADDS